LWLRDCSAVVLKPDSVTLAGAAALISSSTATKVGIIAVAGAAWTGGVDNVITSNTGAGVASVNG